MSVKFDIAMATAESFAYCYRFRCDDGTLLYIGNTTNIYNRLKDHRSLWRISEPINVDIMIVPESERYRVETALIRKYRPQENSFVAHFDNEYTGVPEKWEPFARIYPDEGYRFGKILYKVVAWMQLPKSYKGGPYGCVECAYAESLR